MKVRSTTVLTNDTHCSVNAGGRGAEGKISGPKNPIKIRRDCLRFEQAHIAVVQDRHFTKRVNRKQLWSGKSGFR